MNSLESWYLEASFRFLITNNTLSTLPKKSFGVVVIRNLIKMSKNVAKNLWNQVVSQIKQNKTKSNLLKQKSSNQNNKLANQ